MIFVHHETSGRYNLLRTIDLQEFHRSQFAFARDITFLNGHIVMVTTGTGGVFFISAASGQCVFRFRIELPLGIELYDVTVLSDGRICVGGDDAYCAIVKPPKEVEVWVNEYTERMYSHPGLALIPFSFPPLKGAFDGIQGKYFSIANALELATLSKFNSRSIQEWTFGHQIVMFAVRANVVPLDRKYENVEAY